MQLIQTGGGPPRSVIEDPLQKKILCLITPSAVGLHNPFDSDTLENEPHIESLPVTDTVAGPEVQNKYSTDSAAPSAVHVIEDCLLDWGDYTPKNLKTPISKQLQCSTQGNRKPTAGERLEWMSKRRPQVSTSSLEKLNEIKGNALTTQMKHAAKEREEAKELFDIEMDIRREILRQEKIKTRLLLLELRRNKIKKA